MLLLQQLQLLGLTQEYKMGGVSHLLQKVGLGGGGVAAVQAVQNSASQSTQQATVDSQSSDRENKRGMAKGKKKLQIPADTTTTAPTGTGLNTGV